MLSLEKVTPWIWNLNFTSRFKAIYGASGVILELNRGVSIETTGGASTLGAVFNRASVIGLR